MCRQTNLALADMPLASSAQQAGSLTTSRSGAFSEARLRDDSGYDSDPRALAEDALLEQMFFAPVKQRRQQVQASDDTST